MSITAISARYAKSLVELAMEKKVLDEVVDDIKVFEKVLENRDFFLLIKSPIIKPNRKRKIFSAIFKGRIQELSSLFFDIVIRKGRESYLPEIAKQVLIQYKELKGITTVDFTTASPVTEKTIKTLEEELKKTNWTTDKVDIKVQVDPDILGGFIVEIGDQLYDASIKAKLSEVKKVILDNSYIKSL